MLAVGRKRTKNLHCPPGVFPRGERWYWQPTSARERAERKAANQPVCVPLGRAGSVEARTLWAELAGYRSKVKDGTVAELIALWLRDGLLLQPNGQPRADSTIANYRKDAAALEQRFGSCLYGRTAFEASRGEAIGTSDVQRYVAGSETKGLANRRLAVLDNVFQHAIREGLTTYNPCAEVVKNASRAREREPMPWEVEVLRTLAGRLLGLQMDFEGITGWRIGDIQSLTRAQLTADGVRLRQQKRGKRQLWEWTPELRRIVAEAATLPGATAFPASPVFPSRRGTAQSYKAFDSAWQKLKRRANALLAACDVPLGIADLHFHDLRSKAHDDAEEQGMDGPNFLGNTKGVSRRHYRRREQKVRPLR